MNFTIKTSGFRELDEVLKTMPDKVAKKALKKSVADGIRVIRDQAAANVGEAKSAFAVTNAISKKTGWVAQALLGLSKKRWTLLFKETGTKSHVVEAGKATRKRIAKRFRKGYPYGGAEPADFLANIATGEFFGKKVTIPALPKRPFLSTAFDSKYGAAIEKMREVLGEQIDRLWRSPR